MKNYYSNLCDEFSHLIFNKIKTNHSLFECMRIFNNIYYKREIINKINFVYIGVEHQYGYFSNGYTIEINLRMTFELRKYQYGFVEYKLEEFLKHFKPIGLTWEKRLEKIIWKNI